MPIQADNYPYKVKSGILTHCDNHKQFQQSFLQSYDSGCQFFISNIFSSQYLEEIVQKFLSQGKSEHTKFDYSFFDLDKCFISSDLSFTSTQIQHICAHINQTIFKNVPQEICVQFIKLVVQYSGYLGIKCISLTFIPQKIQTTLSILNKLQNQLFNAKLGVLLHVDLSQKQTDQIWEKYILLKRNLDKNISINLIAEFGPNLLSKIQTNRWIAQKLTLFCFSTDCFTTNQKGYPVLPIAHQNLAIRLFKLASNFILKYEIKVNSTKTIVYMKFLQHTFAKMAKNSEKRQIKARSLFEVLQHPLQPYADNLQSETYSIFEFDAPKYEQYSIAISLALEKMQQPKDKNIIIYYIGSGRGALIPGIVQASKKHKKKVTVYAIQKNPFPLQTLKRRIKQNKWGNIVKIINSDVRTFQFVQEPDIFFSQLLGGFGDNQLSPECLKWAQNKLKNRNKVVCIPQQYAAYIKPVSYSAIHKTLQARQKESYFTINFGWHDSPYESKKIWDFQHPLPVQQKQSLQKKNQCVFDVKQNGTIHGLLGSFDCKLYETSYFSIVPQTQTIGMFSWFPIYFAFVEEQYVKKGQTIYVQMKRMSTQKKVWYQWKYRIQSQGKIVKNSKIHNQNGDIKSIYL